MVHPNFTKTAFMPADILLPQGCDRTKWSVVACDQYTSQPEYWQEVEKTVGSAPSSYKMMLPEIYLNGADEKQRVNAIDIAMQSYLDGGVFELYKDSFIYVERELKNKKLRKGLVGAVDLEAYDFHKGAGSLIRATEGTVLERIPPRMRVRQNAPLEMPHVMLLIDDPGQTVIERVEAFKESLQKLYDFELMKDGGHITGYRVDGSSLESVASALEGLTDIQNFEKKYGVNGRPVMGYAVGDGNHSLATAKQCYEQLKAKLSPEAAAKHPARYALVELVNIHDPSLEFEPIHRVVFDVEPSILLKAFFDFYPEARRGEGEGHRIEYRFGGTGGVITVKNERHGLAVGLLQSFIDSFVKELGGKVDYIHGADVVETLSAKPGAIGFLLPPMGKSELFRAVITDGVLPRKTFSMGEAQDKRFYLECRKIK